MESVAEKMEENIVIPEDIEQNIDIGQPENSKIPENAAIGDDNLIKRLENDGNRMLMFSIGIGMAGLAIGLVLSRRKKRAKTTGRELKNVNCWFCNTDQVVEAYKADGFVCSVCDQYNGFTNDGDYNQVLPEQHYTSLNDQKFRQIAKQNTKKYKKTTESLCDKCNSEQWMKLRREREFNPDIPSDDEEGYEQALRGFRTQLDKEYPLCIKCEFTLKAQELGKYHPLYQKWLADFRRRTLSGTGDFLEAVSKAQDLAGLDRPISQRVARYMISQALSGITLPPVANFIVDVLNSTLKRTISFSLYLRMLPIASNFIKLSYVLPLLYLIRITGVCILSESYFGLSLRLFWIFDIVTSYWYSDWWSSYVWAVLIGTCGTWAAINSLAALCVSGEMTSPQKSAKQPKRGHGDMSVDTMTPDTLNSSGQLTPVYEANAGTDVMTELSGMQSGLRLKTGMGENLAVKSGSSLFGSAFSHIATNQHGLMQTPPPSDINRSVFAKKPDHPGDNFIRNRWSSAPQSPPKNVIASSPERMDIDSDSDDEPTLLPQSFRNTTPILNRSINQLDISPGTKNFSPSQETVMPGDSVSQVGFDTGRYGRQRSPQPLTMDNLRQHEHLHNRTRGFSTSTQFSADHDRGTVSSYHSIRRRNLHAGSGTGSRFSSTRTLLPQSTAPQSLHNFSSAASHIPFSHAGAAAFNATPSPPRSHATRFSNIPRQAEQSFPGSPGAYSNFSGFTTTSMAQQENNNKVLLAGMALIAMLNTVVVVVVMKYMGKN